MFDEWAAFEWYNGNHHLIGYAAKGHVTRETVMRLNDCGDVEPLGKAQHRYGRFTDCDENFPDEITVVPCRKGERGALPITVVEYEFWKSKKVVR